LFGKGEEVKGAENETEGLSVDEERSRLLESEEEVINEEEEEGEMEEEEEEEEEGARILEKGTDCDIFRNN
jgi:hypothetical protein